MQLRRIWRTKQNNSLCHPQENEKFNNDNKCQQVYKSLFLDKNTFFFAKHLVNSKKSSNFAADFGKNEAQMAESVDALVSNTSRFTPVPVRPRLWVQNPA